jgi:hypothetical protein
MYRIPPRTSSAPSPIRNILASQFIAATYSRDSSMETGDGSGSLAILASVTAAEVRTTSIAVSGRHEPQLPFWSKRSVNRALRFCHRLRFSCRLARDHDTLNRRGPLPQVPPDPLNEAILDVPISHH